jgi:hypothetical protein
LATPDDHLSKCELRLLDGVIPQGRSHSQEASNAAF